MRNLELPIKSAVAQVAVDPEVQMALRVGLGFTALVELMSLPACTAATPVPLASPTAETLATATATATPGLETTPTSFVEPGTEASPATLQAQEVVGQYLQGHREIFRDDFEGGVKGSVWNIGEQVTGKDGQVEIEGKQWASFLDLRQPITENQAVVTNFRYVPGSYFELKLHSGQFGTDGYQRFGVYIGTDGQFYVNVFQGTKYEKAVPIPGLVTKPDTWYSPNDGSFPGGQVDSCRLGSS